MRKPAFSWPQRLLSIVLSVFVLAIPAQSGRAQPRIRIPSAPAIPAVDAILQAGKQLESSHRWSAARDHYRDALRQYPGRQELELRLQTARMHTDLARRYRDTSFVDACRTTPLARSIDGLGEMLLKVQAHHFQQPRWAAVARHCYQGLEVAIADPVFTRHHKLSKDSSVQTRFLETAHQLLVQQAPSTRQQLQECIRVLAQRGQQQLGLPAQAVVLECNCAAIMALDRYSSYLTPHQLNEMFSQIEGNFVGLGLELTTSNNQLKIVRVIPGGPAHEAGLLKGDLIIRVDKQETAQVTSERAADLLRGPEGSAIQLTVVSVDGREREMLLRRRRVEVPSVEAVEMIDRKLGIGYFRITSFQKTTSDDVDDALWQLHREGMTSLVIDMRDNPGGLLMASVEVADKFMSQGTIVSTRGRVSSEDIDYQANQLGTWNMPLVVLINENSASASEIFAGAIHDSGRGKIVGQRSYGKGSVQGIFPLANTTAGMRLTTARFYSPSGGAISQKGITPDVIVRTTEKPEKTDMGHSSDVVLQTGLDVLRHIVANRPPR